LDNYGIMLISGFMPRPDVTDCFTRWVFYLLFMFQTEALHRRSSRWSYSRSNSHSSRLSLRSSRWTTSSSKFLLYSLFLQGKAIFTRTFHAETNFFII